MSNILGNAYRVMYMVFFLMENIYGYFFSLTKYIFTHRTMPLDDYGLTLLI